MYGGLDRWIFEWMDRWLVACIDDNVLIYGWLVNGRMNGSMAGWKEGWLRDRWEAG